MMQEAHGGSRRRTAGTRPAVWTLAVALLLAACGEAPGSADPGAPPADPGAASEPAGGEVAPMCDEVDELVAEPAPDGEVTGTTATPLDGPEMPGGGDRPTTREPGWIAEDIEAWAQANAPDAYAGLWVDQSLGGMAVAFTRDVDEFAAAIRAEVHPGIAVAEAANSQQDLRALQEQLHGAERPDGEIVSGDVLTTGSGNLRNRVSVGVYDPTEDRLAELSATYGADRICFEIHEAPPSPSAAVTTLAKVAGHRDGFDAWYATVEIAYDRETAERAWADNVPGDLAPVDADPPADAGRYADLDAVDFDRQALVVWSAGESGSCPSFLVDVEVVEDEFVLDAAGVGGGVCTSDYNAFRVIAAVDRDRLPAPDDLPMPIADSRGDEAVPYPAGG